MVSRRKFLQTGSLAAGMRDGFLGIRFWQRKRHVSPFGNCGLEQSSSRSPAHHHPRTFRSARERSPIHAREQSVSNPAYARYIA